MDKKIDICYVISNGFSARMLFQTGLIPQLAENNRIAIISPDINDSNLIAYREEGKIELYEAKDPKDLWSSEYLFKRKYYLEDIRNNHALWEKHIYHTRYSKTVNPWRRIRPYYYYLIHRLIKLFPSIKEKFLKKEKTYLFSKGISDLIFNLRPSLVVSTYPVNLLEARVLFAANQQQIPTVIHLLSWDNITCKGRFPVSADYFVAWGPIMVRELEDYYKVLDERIYACGVPHFDAHVQIKNNPQYQHFVIELGLNPTLPYIFVGMSAPRFAPKEIDIVEHLADQIKMNNFGKEMQLIVRPHPQNVIGNLADQSWLKRLDNIIGDRVKVDYPKVIKSKLVWSMKKDDMGRLSNLLAGATVVLNSGSTISIDALMVGKPVIITSFDGNHKLAYWKSARRLINYPHLKKFVNLGGVKTAFSYNDLNEYIKLFINTPNTDMELRNYTLMQECGEPDGKATQRVIEAMNSILEKTKASSTALS